LDDLGTCSSTAFGAIASGATPFAVYMLYLFHVTVALRRWKKGEKTLNARKALRAFLPVQFGGLALESMITLAGSLAGPTIPEQIGMLHMIGIRYPETRVHINAMLDSMLKPASRSAKIYNPSNMVVYGKRLRSDRFTLLLEKIITQRVVSPVMTALIGPKSTDEVGYVELVLDEGGHVPVPLRELIRDTEKFEVVRKVARKFLTARSALVFVKGRELAKVTYKNRNEANSVVALFT
jgi:hypothetical protein